MTVADGGGGEFDHLVGLNLAQREMYRRMRGCDSEGKGCFASVEYLAKGDGMTDFQWSLSQAREIIRQLREKGLILLAGVRRKDWTHVYIFADRSYRETDLNLCPKATAALLATSRRYVEQAQPERRAAAAAGWSTEGARQRIHVAGGEARPAAPNSMPVQILGVYINGHLAKAYSRAVLEEAVRAMVDYYGPKLDQKGGVRHPAAWLKKKCARIAEQRRQAAQPTAPTAPTSPSRAPEPSAPTAPPAPPAPDPEAEAVAEELRRAEEEGRFAEVFLQQMERASAQRRQSPTSAPTPAAEPERAERMPAAEPAPVALVPVASVALVPAAPAALVPAASGEPAAEPTIIELVRRWVERKRLDTAKPTQGYYQDRVSTIERLVGTMRASEWDHDAVLAYGKYRGSDVKPTTFKRELDMIKGALIMARRSNRALAARLDDPKSYWPTLNAPVEAKKGYLRRGEMPVLLRALSHQYKRDWVLWAVYTGGRRSELRGLQWEDIDTESGRLHIRGTKTKKSDRWVPLHDELVRWCVEKRSQRRCTGKILGHWGNVNRDLAAACEAMGLRRISPNDLRRTFGSWLRQAGVPDAVIAELMGHEDTEMVARVYGQLTEEQAREAIQKL